jgi:diguanylate cyclase (GGDEF)-like protein/PAS domain S-box-containing protein
MGSPYSRGRTISSVYQPIVDLGDGSLVAMEALARGGPAPWSSPARLFDDAARAGTVAELDRACLQAALAGVRDLPGPATVFVNVEPATLAGVDGRELQAWRESVPDSVQIVLELTERGLLERPAQLLRAVGLVREVGWGVALDDVGAAPAGLALMPFLRPDVIKLDLSLIREQSTLQTASVINAVRSEAERSGVVVVAEGIEDERHLERALAMGAQLGQGWRFGSPGPLPETRMRPLAIPAHRFPLSARAAGPAGTPFEVLSAAGTLQRATAPLLASMTRQVEYQAMLLDDQTVVLANFQSAQLMTPATLRRYEALARVTALTAVTGVGLSEEPAPGVRGWATDADDPLGQEWAVTVVSPHFAAALAARDIGRGPGLPGTEPEPASAGRRLDYALTYDRSTVLEAAALLLDRIGPRRTRPTAPVVPVLEGPPPGVVDRLAVAELPDLLLRAISTASNGIVIADARLPDLPLVYANEAFLRLTGYPEEDVLGRNCRFLQGPGTDRTQVHSITRRLLAGRGVHAVLLNYRRDGSTFWNELQISAVRDGAGAVTHYVGNQLDVTSRIDREQRTAYLAYHDHLTGLPNRAQLLEHLELELERARRSGRSVAVVLVDLDDFKAINDRLGHAAGDAALTSAARRLRSVVRAGDLLGRVGGDEFLLVLAGLPPTATVEGSPVPDPAAVDHAVAHVRANLHSALEEPVELAGAPVRVSASSGAAVFPRDAGDASGLLALADSAMYRHKERSAS